MVGLRRGSRRVPQLSGQDDVLGTYRLKDLVRTSGDLTEPPVTLYRTALSRRLATRHVESNYRSGYQRRLVLLRFFNNSMGEPSGAAKVIGRALAAALPRARYLIGRDAQAFATVQPFIPTELRDRVTRLVAGL